MNEKYKNIERERFKNMTAEEKLDISLRLYYSAWELKFAALKQFHSDWDDKKIEEEVKKNFFYART